MGAAGLAAAALIGCGDDDDEEPAPSPATAAPSTSTPAPSAATPTATEATATATPRAAPSRVTPTSTPTPAPVTVSRGGHVNFGQDRDWMKTAGFDPHTSAAQSSLWRLMMDPIVAMDATATLDPESSLAESWEITADTTVVFNIRQGVKFHDGTDFNASAAKFNLDRARDPDLKGAVFVATFAGIESIDVPDEATAVFNLSRPDASLLESLTERGGLITSPTHVMNTPADDLPTNPVGTGPYRFTGWQPDSRISFERFDDYWRRREDGGPWALLDSFDSVIIPDAVVLAASLQAGDVDVIVAPDSQYDVLKDDGSLEETTWGASTRAGFWVNHGLYPTDNVNFRRALSWSWDAPLINDSFYGGRATIADSILPQSSWAHSPSDAWGSDMQKAMDYMRASGIPESDRKLVVTAISTATYEAMVPIWAQLGVETELVLYREGGSSRVWGSRGQAGDIQIFWVGGGHRAGPQTPVALAFKQSGGWNIGAAPIVPELEKLVDDAVLTYDLEERAEIYARIQELHGEHMYSIIPKLNRPKTMFHRTDRVEGVAFFADGFPDHTNVQTA